LSVAQESSGCGLGFSFSCRAGKKQTPFGDDNKRGKSNDESNSLIAG